MNSAVATADLDQLAGADLLALLQSGQVHADHVLLDRALVARLMDAPGGAVALADLVRRSDYAADLVVGNTALATLAVGSHTLGEIAASTHRSAAFSALLGGAMKDVGAVQRAALTHPEVAQHALRTPELLSAIAPENRLVLLEDLDVWLQGAAAAIVADARLAALRIGERTLVEHLFEHVPAARARVLAEPVLAALLAGDGAAHVEVRPLDPEVAYRARVRRESTRARMLRRIEGAMAALPAQPVTGIDPVTGFVH
jgi:hypothetical protein